MKKYPTPNLSLRLSADDLAKLREVAQETRLTLSEVVRGAIRAAYAKPEILPADELVAERRHNRKGGRL